MVKLHKPGRWTRALAVAIALGPCLVAYGDDVLDPNNGYGPNDRPVYTFVSVSDTFVLPIINTVDNKLRRNAPSMGSKMIRVKIGTFLAGDSIETSRFQSEGPAFFDPEAVPPEPGTQNDPADFDGNHLTIVGSFKTLDPDSTVHLMTPFPQPISASVQQAYFNASVFFDGVDGLSQFPSTVEAALFIYDHQGLAGATFNEILQEIFYVDFVIPVVVAVPTPPLGTAEGILFPHTPANGEYGFDIDLDFGNGIVDADVCLDIDIDVKPGTNNNTINVKSDKGVVPIGVLTTDDFDAVTELDPSTVVAVLIGTDGEVIKEVQPDRFTIHDFDGDGDDDVTYKFSVRDLVDGPNAPLTPTSTSITFRGDTWDGMCVQGTAVVQIVPK